MEKLTVPFELKGVDLSEGTFEGYAAIFNNVDLGNDLIEPGAFTKTLKENSKRVKICWQHDTKEPIGIPLEMKEDSTGLWVKGRLSQTSRGRDALILMRDGVINELSIGYDTIKYKYDGPVRHLKEVRLWEFSPVTFAMNPTATVTSIKSMDENDVLFDYTLVDENCFHSDSFSVVDISDGVKSIVGRLADSNKEITQSLIFTKSIYPDIDSVNSWFNEHPYFGDVQLVNNPADKPDEEKSGRVLSFSNRELIKKCTLMLQTLLDATEPVVTQPEEDDTATPESTKLESLHKSGADNISHSELDDELLSMLVEMKKFARR